jgi:hypothetical protein
MAFLQQEFPLMLPRYEQLYAGGGKNAPRDYQKQVQDMVAALRDRYGLHPRKRADSEHPSEAAPAEETQVGFAW